jgi:hypothetical protein
MLLNFFLPFFLAINLREHIIFNPILNQKQVKTRGWEDPSKQKTINDPKK